jgi:hypothetical protein
MQFRGHTGYEHPERQIHDLEVLRERFGAEERISPRVPSRAARVADSTETHTRPWHRGRRGE